MASVAMTSPLAPVVAAVEGLRRRYPALICSVFPGLVITPTADWTRATNPEAAAVLLVAGWTRARRVPLLLPGETFLNRAGQLGVRRAKVAVLADDPAAGAPGVVVAEDRDELLSLVAEHAGADLPRIELARHVRHFTMLLTTPAPPSARAASAPSARTTPAEATPDSRTTSGSPTASTAPVVARTRKSGESHLAVAGV